MEAAIMKKIVCIVGTRPEAIKMSVLIHELRNDSEFAVSVLATGQHTDMLTQALSDFGLIADENLSIMRDRQSLDHITASVLQGVGSFLDENPQDMILVHGDTSTTFAATLAAFYRHIPVGHVEAGLRSHDLSLPFPEEANRVLTDRIASVYFAPTAGDAENLLREGIAPEKIHVTGNTVIDALYWILGRDGGTSIALPDGRPVVLMTAHRRESWGKPLVEICGAVRDVIRERSDVVFVIPLHKNPTVRDVIREELKDCGDSVIFTEPMGYAEFVRVMNASEFILSDSGGVQEEASAIDKPVLIMRTVSERPEAILHGTGVLVGTGRENIRNEALRLLNEPERMSEILAKNTKPFGNGEACRKIHEAVRRYFYGSD
ncbi:MAG: UDP-N-acetylglucosamine 2-epimerase (non-hydrolyzing) [Synergistaceae bacterium]|nr:UDP-N-acetylglucosamine 2-epimerase (non-hydrolyzing) [Synergistaceae bacterium]